MSTCLQNRSVVDFGGGLWRAALLLAVVLAGALLIFERAEASTTPREDSAVPFGMDTEPVFGGTLPEKWRRVKVEITRDREAIAQCRTNYSCPAPVQKLIDLSREGAGRSERAQVGLINRAVDLAIKPVSDERQWGIPDRWSDPFETILSERGDCEDYAILKYTALLEAGFPKESLKIVVWKNRLPDEDHAVLAVRVDNQWLILDNRTLTLVRDVDVTRATPEFVLDEQGVRRLVANNRTGKMPG